MKKQLSLSLLVLIFSSTFSYCIAQQQSHRSMSSNGYWVIESNTKTPKHAILYFYNPENVLVYKESVEGIKINVNRKKVVNRLNNVLEQSLIAWQQEHTPGENRMLVSLSLKH